MKIEIKKRNRFQNRKKQEGIKIKIFLFELFIKYDIRKKGNTLEIMIKFILFIFLFLFLASASPLKAFETQYEKRLKEDSFFTLSYFSFQEKNCQEKIIIDGDIVSKNCISIFQHPDIPGLKKEVIKCFHEERKSNSENENIQFKDLSCENLFSDDLKHTSYNIKPQTKTLRSIKNSIKSLHKSIYDQMKRKGYTKKFTFFLIQMTDFSDEILTLREKLLNMTQPSEQFKTLFVETYIRIFLRLKKEKFSFLSDVFSSLRINLLFKPHNEWYQIKSTDEEFFMNGAFKTRLLYSPFSLETVLELYNNQESLICNTFETVSLLMCTPTVRGREFRQVVMDHFLKNQNLENAIFILPEIEEKILSLYIFKDITCFDPQNRDTSCKREQVYTFTLK